MDINLCDGSFGEAFRVQFTNTYTMELNPDSKDDPVLLEKIKEFKNKNHHVCVEAVDFYGDGDGSWEPGYPSTGHYENVVDLYCTFLPWWEENKNNQQIVINGKGYIIFYQNTQEVRVIDVDDKQTYYYNYETKKLSKG